MSLPLNTTLLKATFQLHSTQSRVTGVIRTSPVSENVQLLSCLALSLDLSPIENVWSIVAERLARHHKRVTTVYELWHLVETASKVLPLRAIQSMNNSIPKRIIAVTCYYRRRWLFFVLISQDPYFQMPLKFNQWLFFL